MTPDQFAVIAQLTRSRGGAAEDAARAVLVHDLSPSTAAAQHGCSRQSVSNALARFRDAEALINTAW